MPYAKGGKAVWPARGRVCRLGGAKEPLTRQRTAWRCQQWWGQAKRNRGGGQGRKRKGATSPFERDLARLLKKHNGRR